MYQVLAVLTVCTTGVWVVLNTYSSQLRVG